MTIKTLITGGGGYIGSHLLALLQSRGRECVVLDNFSNCSPLALQRVQQMTRASFKVVRADVRDREAIQQLLIKESISEVVHLAALKSVVDSLSDPLAYYENNVNGSISLLRAMANAQVFKFVFSSSATVYGEQSTSPINERAELGKASNPYALSKQIVERVLFTLAHAEPRWQIAVLRYFNPVGAHPSGLIGEEPRGVPSNLLPYLNQVAMGRLLKLQVFGTDYPTPDGTAIRDYIHIEDLALGHLNALNRLNKFPGVNIWNLGSGTGYSVFEVISAFEKACGKSVPVELVGRRKGDVAISFADTRKAQVELGWQAKHGLHDMMRDSWNWQLNNPRGYC